MTDIPTVPLASGGTLPQLGFGTYRIAGARAAATIATAIEAGYRLLDTAAMYDNEAEVGEGIRRSGVDRDELIVTTKIGRGTPSAAVARERVGAALGRLGLECIDVLLIHGPNPDREVAVDTWRGLLEVQRAGLVTTVGVSNFSPTQLTQLHEATGVWPAVNQVQLSPALQRRDMVEFHREHGIVSEAWSPLGIEHGVLVHPVVESIADKHRVTPALVALRWGMQRGHVVIPKASSPERQRENLRVVEFELDDTDMATIADLDLAAESRWEASGYAAW